MNTYKKIMLMILAIILISIPSYGAEYTSGDVIVVLRPSTPKITASSFHASSIESVRLSSFAASSGASVQAVYSSLSEADNSIYALIHSDTKNPEDLTRELLNNPEVLAASPNYKVRAAITPNDPRYSDCWGMDYINASSAWDITTGSSDVYVAIVDTGIDDTNPDLAPNTVMDLGRNVMNVNASARDDNGHGSHVAGTIGAVGNNGIGVAGLNWDIGLIPVKVLNSKGEGDFNTVMSGLNHVVNLINQGVNVVAVNMSLETYIAMRPTHDNLVKIPLWRSFKAVDMMNKAVIVVAAGNESETVGEPSSYAHGSMVLGAGYYVYPASFVGLDNMISVSAINSWGFTALYSNRGGTISAPGSDVLSTWTQGNSDGVSLHSESGTSMAAPHVSGAIALLASVMPKRTAYQLKQAVLQGSNVSSANVRASASGILDVRAALDYQEAHGATLPESTTANADYNDYESYEIDTQVYRENEGASSGCNSGVLGLSVLMVLVFPLARKLMS